MICIEQYKISWALTFAKEVTFMRRRVVGLEWAPYMIFCY